MKLKLKEFLFYGGEVDKIVYDEKAQKWAVILKNGDYFLVSDKTLRKYNISYNSKF